MISAFLGVFFLLPSSIIGSLPVITENPVDQIVARGEPATLNCGARGDPEPFISWYKDGKPLNVVDRSDHVVLLPGGSLFFLRTVENSKGRDSGSYHCVADNRDGTVQSRPAKLTVNYIRSKFGDVQRNIEVGEGDILRISCKPPEGNPKPKIYWEKDGMTLINDDFFIIEENGDLLIAEAGVEDTGSYVCLASSADQTRRDQPVRVKVVRQAVVIQKRVTPSIPEISESHMLDAVTGLVHWLPLKDVTGYTVLVTASGEQVTNISVEHDVSQIKLHSLDPSQVYSVQVAGIYGDTHGGYSTPRQLAYKTHEVVLVNNEEIPIKVWAIAMAIVIIVTLTIVMAAALLCYKTKKFRNSSSRHSNACSEYGVPRTMNWDRPWDDHSPTTSFRSQNRLLQGGGAYEYAVPNQPQYSGGSNHYASNTILKPAYYEPLNLNLHSHLVDTSNSSFESEYKSPLDINSQR